MTTEKPVIPKNILEIEKQIKATKFPEDLQKMTIVIVKETAGNSETFTYLQKAFVKQKRKLGMKYIWGKKMTI